ncbi:MAG: threonylcarbamoyl-AMP synthase [Gammaproteobacteria bacterium]|nr:threonylcarbamoyl-AMP synthase [Gammaproteobacteria bacterium]MDB2596778.1 L-threonylcarbamoyladenylate synthase [Pseudomonadales bacterium]MBT5333651.1 threonylcarbamoyl-AMP synthase [Gammaproteobacteria bacterium]MBT5682126.1 threonylcarbamoyl-AMP synthase [Gammaproteobacteria bacterium]MBT6024636.1 threonylcarbamoyl-AMP synthase [Gammaproteobacteria bacterium]
MAQHLRVHPTDPQNRLLKIAAEALHKGGLVIYPSDTTYAIACHMGDKAALEKIITLRNLDKNHQFSLACRDLSDLATYAKVENADYRLLKRNTPGPFTFILQASREVPKRLVHPKKKLIGLRVPDHPIVQGLLEIFGEPMVTATLRLEEADENLGDIEEIVETLGNHRDIDVILDGGPCGIETSTIVDLSDGDPVVVRQGLGVLS